MRKDMLFAVAVAIGAILVTTGGVVSRGDIMQELHAFDAETGTALWNSAPPAAPIQTSAITFAVDGKSTLLSKIRAHSFFLVELAKWVACHCRRIKVPRSICSHFPNKLIDAA